jgi:hypothetical protein
VTKQRPAQSENNPANEAKTPKKRNKLAKTLAITATALAITIAGAGLAVGNYVYTSGTQVPCAINDDDKQNSPEQFFTPAKDNGPFPGEGWNKWVDHDLSEWWMTDPYEAVTIPVAENINLAAWHITPEANNGKTVIVTHGIGTSRRDFNALLPTGDACEKRIQRPPRRHPRHR